MLVCLQIAAQLELHFCLGEKKNLMTSSEKWAKIEQVSMLRLQEFSIFIQIFWLNSYYSDLQISLPAGDHPASLGFHKTREQRIEL